MKNESLLFTGGLSRRRMLGTLMLGSGAILSGMGMTSIGDRASRRGQTILSGISNMPKGLEEAVQFPLIEALYGRRARRFALGDEIEDGPLKFKSKFEPMGLSDLEQMMVLAAAAGNTGWHNMIYRNKTYAPHLSNYSAAAGGRTFPSAAGFHTTEFFFTDDTGVYFLPTRDSGNLVPASSDGSFDLDGWLKAHKKRIVKLADGRLNLPAEEPYMEGHNTWCVNRPGSTLIIPVADIAQHMVLTLCYLVQNGYCVYNDVHNEKIPGMEKFKDIVDIENPYPLTFMEQYALTESTAEVSTACYAGMLMLQAIGLGGWMFDGIDRFSMLGASGNPQVPGLGFNFETREDWPLPHVTGLPGIFEGLTPPHVADMTEAVKKVVDRKFNTGGPFNKKTPGPWKESPRVRDSAQFHDPHFQECVATQAQYVFDKFGKFPATVPAIFILTYLQAHNLDLEFYDTFFKDGAYLQTHAQHNELWNRQPKRRG